jgi:hypothetical protein
MMDGRMEWSGVYEWTDNQVGKKAGEKVVLPSVVS